MDGFQGLVEQFDSIDMSGYVEYFKSLEIGDNVAVRSGLKADDLRLLRRVFLCSIRSGLAGSDAKACRDLMKRMLRRVG